MPQQLKMQKTNSNLTTQGQRRMTMQVHKGSPKKSTIEHRDTFKSDQMMSDMGFSVADPHRGRDRNMSMINN